MARVVTDYPELKHLIGDMSVIDPNSENLMSTVGTRGGTHKASFEYNKKEDREGPIADQERLEEDEKERNAEVPFHSSPRDYHGTHEMGHALASLLIESDGSRIAKFSNTKHADRVDEKVKEKQPMEFRLMDSRPLTNRYQEEMYELPENDMLESVLADKKAAMIRKYKLFDPVTYQAEAVANNHNFMKGMASLKGYDKKRCDI